MSKLDLFNSLKEEWRQKNEEFFGIPVERESNSYSDMLHNFKVYQDKYWNNPKTRCKICSLLFEDSDSNMSEFIPYEKDQERTGFFIADTDSYITVYGWFKTDNINRKAFPVFIIPRILETLEWKIGSAEYIPRNVAKRNQSTLGKIDNRVFLSNRFSFDCSTGEVKEFKVGGFSARKLDPVSIKYLKAFCPDFEPGENKEKFKKHLMQLPDTNYRNLINYHFYDSSYFFEQLSNAVHMVNPTVNRSCNLCSALISSGRKKKEREITGKMREEDPDCTLILNSEKSIVYAMDNYRSALYVSSNYSSTFYFEYTELVFDAFKTATSKAAGKIRTLLDDVYIGEDHLLYKKLPDGRVLNQYELFAAYYLNGDKSVKTKSLSVLTETPYCNNNDPKRIMMTSKSMGQSIPIQKKYEYDPIVHSTLGRVVFGDFFGFTNGDGIVISESFATKMTSYKMEKMFIPKSNKEKWKIYQECWDEEEQSSNRDMSIEELTTLLGYSKNNLNRYNNIRIVDSFEITREYGSLKNRKGVYVSIYATIPVKVGDKFTNYHGSKGVITRIIPDNEMPKLTKKCGSMEPGPFDIIISSYGIAKRGTTGQLIEAYTRMNNMPMDLTASEVFSGDISEYKEPLIEYNGTLTNKCFGIQEIIRLQHLSISHASFSGINKAPNFMLNFGEMENLFMSAQGLVNIQKEISQRSQKFYNREQNINNIILNKEAKDLDDLDFNMEFLSILYSFGYNIKVEKVDD